MRERRDPWGETLDEAFHPIFRFPIRAEPGRTRKSFRRGMTSLSPMVVYREYPD